MFVGLCHSGTDQRDYLYFIAEGYYKLNEYKSALRYTNRLLQIEPENRQGLELHEKITGQMKKDGLIGLGILGGTALVMGGAAALVGMVFASRKWAKLKVKLTLMQTNIIEQIG